MLNLMGASLYVPASHRRLLDIANGQRLPHLRSVIFCTEDAVAERHLDWALLNLSAVLRQMRPGTAAARFVRVRNPEVMQQVLAMPGADHLTGFVIPKATRENLGQYLRQVRSTAHVLMPTLETAEVFDDNQMQKLRALLEKPGVRNRILALRIGGNDLLALLGLRRPRTETIYSTPIGPVIARLVTTFRPYGFMLTAPVFEHIDLPELLDKEVAQDLAYGMVGKTAIHPAQIERIEQHYRVRQQDVAAAQAILDETRPAVFRMNGSMCEPATHRAWAEQTIAQSRMFGTSQALPPGPAALTIVRNPA